MEGMSSQQSRSRVGGWVNPGNMLINKSIPKQYVKLGNETVLTQSVKAFLEHPQVDLIQVVIHSEDQALHEESVSNF